MDPKDVNLCGHALVLAMLVAWVLPVLGNDWGYTAAIFASVMVGGYTIRANYGMPALEGFSFSNWRAALQPVQMWVARVMQGSEIQYLMFAMVWMSAPPSLAVAVVLGRRSLWSVCTRMSASYAESTAWRVLGSIWTPLKAQEVRILKLCVQLEILLGFVVIFRIFTSGMSGALSAYMYWSFLRMRYTVALNAKPTNAARLHREVWAWAYTTAEPLLSAVPILNTPIDMASKWFTTLQ
eukprot:TRINITY_DN28202_c0_g1_i1.p1 TRINITY_DN28202_c0_g1~~TRINITY_DN28202_c0_g1_i1.p1  ORF type:complete len:238 (+),score=71.97 TRINITY_DN28202_c0_g1_i1:132-845(+)